MTDAEFVRQARAKWPQVLDVANTKDGTTAGLMVAMWATLHVDRLLDIAEGKILEREA